MKCTKYVLLLLLSLAFSFARAEAIQVATVDLAVEKRQPAGIDTAAPVAVVAVAADGVVPGNGQQNAAPKLAKGRKKGKRGFWKQMKSFFDSGFHAGPNLTGRTKKPAGRGLSISSLVFGILSIFSYVLALVFALLAIILGAVALKKEGTNGMAIAGIVLGSVFLFLWIIAIIIIAVLLGSLFAF